MLGPENGGLGRYVEQLVKHLLEADSENQYVLFLTSANWEKVTVNTNRVQKVLSDIPWYSLAEQVRFSGIIKQAGVDLMHFPHWNVPVLYRAPFVLTIHDLIMYHYPRAEATTLGPIVYFFKDLAHRLVLRSAARRAKKILVTSEFTKQDVFETLGVPKEKMVVTYQAPFENKEPIANSQEPIENVDSPAAAGSRLAAVADSPFVLYVGSAYPHKNLSGLLKAWQIFTEKNGNEFQLVLVGKDSEFYRRQFLNSSISQFTNVVHLTFVSDTELVTLYKKASLYIFPSLYEGFGLPPLEAMCYGVPVISSNRTCLPEVLGEAALYFDPENYEQMADVIGYGLRNEDLRATLRENAKHELQKYSWKRLAEQTLAVYRSVMS